MPRSRPFEAARLITAEQGPDSALRRAVGRDWKGRASPLAYVLELALVLVARWPVVSLAIYVAVAFIWLVPDRRIERSLSKD